MRPDKTKRREFLKITLPIVNQMAYVLHIKRSSPISVDEWLAAVESIDDLRIDGSDSVATNPLTGKVVRISGSPGTAAWWFSEPKEWIKVFWLRRGEISFKANGWDNTIIREIALALAGNLKAEIVGDEGETYT